ncbi:MAG: ferric reductase-like transmembrane domain-containing protein [Coriobacteriia bacterium]
MTFLISLFVIVGLVIVSKSLIAKYPYVFYAVAVIIDLVYVIGRFFGSYNPLLFRGLEFIQKGWIAFILLAIVMFIGAFDQSWKIRQWLNPIRTELSILACLLALGHVAGYLTSYLTTLIFDSGVIPPVVLVSLSISIVLFALLLVLTITSLKSVRQRMNKATWKKIQRTSYVFFGLVYAHLMLMLVPGALKGAAASTYSVVIYTVIFAAYLILRGLKAVSGRRYQAVLENGGDHRVVDY